MKPFTQKAVAWLIAIVVVVIIAVSVILGFTTVDHSNLCIVVDKEFFPSYKTSKIDWSSAIPSLTHILHPERWVVSIEGANEKSEITAASIDVPEYVYNAIEIGDRVRVNGDELTQVVATVG